MGLLKHLLFWPVTGPEFLVKYSLGKVEGVVREELTDDQAIKEDLMALQMELELGEIDDDQYLEREAQLMQRLRDVRHWREQFGMGTSGGPVQVARDAPRADAEEVHDLAEEAGPPPESVQLPEEDEPPARGGIAQPGGASVEIKLDWE